MRRIVIRFAAAGAVLAAALGLAACGGAGQKAPAGNASASGERMTVRLTEVGDYKPVAATVTTRNMGEARARIGGTLIRLAVREGDYVRKGQVIAVVADRRLAYETGALRAQAAAAQAQAARAEADLARVRTLYDKGFYAKARLDQAEAEAKAARGAAAAAGAQTEASAETSAQGAVLAPATGRVLRADVPAGSVVTAGQSIVTVTAGEPLLRLEIPEAEARGLHVGDPVALDPNDLPAAQAAGAIVQLYPAVSGGRVTADISVPGLNADHVGQRVRVRVRIGERRALTLPRRFVATRYGIDYVRLVDRTGHASDIAVQLAPAPDAGVVEILSGLSDGDVVAAPGAAS